MKKEDYYDSKAKSREFSHKIIIVGIIIFVVLGFLNLIFRF